MTNPSLTAYCPLYKQTIYVLLFTLKQKKTRKNLINDPPTFRKLSKHSAVKITKTKLPQQFLFEKKAEN